MKVCAHSEGPELVKTCTNHTNEDLEDEDENNLLVCLHLKLRELSASLALISHDPGVVSRVYNNTVHPFSILQGCASKHKVVVVKRKWLICERIIIALVQSTLELVKLVIRCFALDKPAKCSSIIWSVY
jgi:hypothetical protein